MGNRLESLILNGKHIYTLVVTKAWIIEPGVPVATLKCLIQPQQYCWFCVRKSMCDRVARSSKHSQQGRVVHRSVKKSEHKTYRAFCAKRKVSELLK